MDNITHYPTLTTPLIISDFQQGEVLISGIAIPDNAPVFFKPISNWITNFLATEFRTLTLHLDLEYTNNLASRCIISIISQLNKFTETGQIIWHYFSDDEDVIADGEDFQTIAKFPFRLQEMPFNETLKIKATEQTPLIYFDALGDFIVSGNCQSQNPRELYLPAIKWLNRYRLKSKSKKASFEFAVNQVNPMDEKYLKAIEAMADIFRHKGFDFVFSKK
jgi:hypothetical protein